MPLEERATPFHSLIVSSVVMSGGGKEVVFVSECQLRSPRVVHCCFFLAVVLFSFYRSHFVYSERYQNVKIR